MKSNLEPLVFRSISGYMKELGLSKPLHPLIALVKYNNDEVSRNNAGRTFLAGFYKVAFKQTFSGNVKYGQGYYDFEEGGLAFFAPNQLITMSTDESCYEDGYNLYFHADFIRNYQLGKNINQYGFFNYAVHESLFISDKEKKIIMGILENISTELDNNTDNFSQDVLVSQIELLLNYSNRFYNRQFLTRKTVHNDLIAQVDLYLTSHFTEQGEGLPTVQEVADQFNVSSRYLSDMLKSLTGSTAQHHIHDRLIEKSKEMLSTTRLTVAEIAYQFGFEHPQSFNKLFKRFTDQTPNSFRKSFN